MARNRQGYVEQAAGSKAPWRVYYRRNGKLYWDAMWAPTADEACAKMLACAKEVGWKVTIERIEDNRHA